jgi:hypothetical protein
MVTQLLGKRRSGGLWFKDRPSEQKVRRTPSQSVSRVWWCTSIISVREREREREREIERERDSSEEQ